MAIPITGTMKPAGKFPLVEAADVSYGSGRLSDYMPVCVTQEEYDALVAAGEVKANTPYLIKSDDL